jgi:hypothetical protein
VSAPEQIDAEIERLEGQREEALARAADSERKLKELNEPRIALAPPAFAGDEAADRELVALEEQAGRLSQKARLARNTASELGRLVEEAEARRAKEERRAHLGRHAGLSEERYQLEVGLEGAMSELLEGLERLRKLDADQHGAARAAGLNMEHRYRPLVAGWLSSRLRGYLPLREVDEAYREPLFDVDGQNLESEGGGWTRESEAGLLGTGSDGCPVGGRPSSLTVFGPRSTEKGTYTVSTDERTNGRRRKAPECYGPVS